MPLDSCDFSLDLMFLTVFYSMVVESGPDFSWRSLKNFKIFVCTFIFLGDKGAMFNLVEALMC